MSNAIAVVKLLEWGAIYSYCTGWSCCPVCKGIKPGHGRDENGDLPRGSGHSPDCILADAIKEAE